MLNAPPLSRAGSLPQLHQAIQDCHSTDNPLSQDPPAWGAVLAMALAAFVLVASEFMPVSLLTPVAADLHVSEGQAGQGIAVSGAFALITSLFIASIAARVDRKWLLLGLTLLMIVSGTVVAFAPNYSVFMVGRALIGIAIGGFWSLSAATAMRLVPDAQIPRALAIVNGGNALATVVAAPLGSFLGAIIGWRGAFFCIVPIVAIALVWLLLRLPALHAFEGEAGQ
ncbi:Major Facilitator Superfamily protein [Pseudomonas sp. NFACC52]|nr:Major Facilitator Superfamily protein [Pseudomonas sp. NFACC56-3]SFK21264.1 Major Facilitator Superfamily protein [Pseudomonas sp. NFACC52]